MPAKKSLFLLLLCISAGIRAFAGSDTVSVYFPFDKSMLTDEAMRQVDLAIYKGVISDKKPIQIIGYADQVGENSYNYHLSVRRATSVRAYLVRSGFRADRITLIIGKGEETAQPVTGPDGNQADRRVDIVQSASSPAVRADRFVLKPDKPASAAGNAAASTPRKASATDLSTVSQGEILVLDKIYFYPGRHVFRDISHEALEALYTMLMKRPDIRIRIEGHVCCTPGQTDALDEDTYKNELSINRALAVRDYLIKRGIAANRLEYAGFARQRPVVDPETSEEEADKNRRVEIRMIK
jgi:outer membrane protein OmpA-like peptidoglycan-associated protein